jgi:hypothetical protein
MSFVDKKWRCVSRPLVAGGLHPMRAMAAGPDGSRFRGI